MKKLLLALCFIPISAQAQLVSGGAQDLSGYATVSAVTAMAATIPTPASATPPGVADAGTIGTTTTQYALANHTHASKARKGRATTATDGTLTVTLTPAFTATPVCNVVAEANSGETNIVNAQLDGVPTTTQMKVRVNRAAAVAVGLISLTVAAIQPAVATVVDYICIEP